MKGWELDLGDDGIVTPTSIHKHISLLLGAGFSEPKGYPIGNKLNEAFVSYAENSDGVSNENNGIDPNIKRKALCLRLIKLYNKKHDGFDFEEFYDQIHKPVELKTSYYKEGCKDIIGTNFGEDYDSLVNNLESIYTSIEQELLKPKGDNIWHNTFKDIEDSSDKYYNFLKALSNWSKEATVHVHTLNHDMLFESFQKTEGIDQISDGFDDFGSRYYGKFQIKGSDESNADYRVRLARFSNRYQGSHIRLYKLHGSLNYVPFHRYTLNCRVVVDKYVKTQCGIDMWKLEKACGSKMHYEQEHISYQSDILTGTETKSLRYNEPQLYKPLFKHFKNNLLKSELLVIIGYGWHDYKINSMIEESFNKNGKVIVVNPEPSNEMEEFIKKSKARLIQKSISEITLDDLTYKQ